jgi:hypothetical protein
MKIPEKVFFWAPRILGILAISFVSMFALDAFQPELTIWEQLRDFLMHLVPSFILLAILLVAWKWELIGGIIFIAIGLVFTPVVYLHNYRMNGSVWMSLTVIAMITLPFIVMGILFIIHHKLKKRKLNS